MSAASGQPDISIILTAHGERLLAGPCGHSVLAATAAAENEGLRCETIVVLDRADRLTRSVLTQVFSSTATFLETDEGDPGPVRNRGTEAASGRFSAFIDADDLWSENWLVESHAQARMRPDAVFHPACIFRFGGERLLFWHADSESGLCDPTYLDWFNYWDSMSFALTDIYRRFPFRANDLKRSFGHEDWYWNVDTLAKGVAHKPTPETIHFKRGRPGSQMSKVAAVDGFRWPLARGELYAMFGKDRPANTPPKGEG